MVVVKIVIVQATTVIVVGSCHKRQKPQAPTPQAPIRNRQTRKVVTAILSLPNLILPNLT